MKYGVLSFDPNMASSIYISISVAVIMWTAANVMPK
ncbi:MAG: hypothetical protein CM1200mP41_39360 [Gammaproteobacteria bacterium]|nr:MAG: hypothetical protein CM1200mP41_39360 [Gammaproteobacteria bacterium]